ncbi:MAG: beta-Ala-His dipeptidase [Clostridia bacterium]|nr:beta-Ala-His dipeptidase [Clostridia bacterium]
MQDSNSLLKPQRVFELFSEISEIPRASGHEDAIAAYLVSFAERNHLTCYRDAHNNVLLQYTPAQSEKPCLLLQGHSDMVCVAEPSAAHDFAVDPLELFVDGDGMLGAKNTTLGADNGIALAMTLALLEEKPPRPLDCLFTTSEEVGMEGAIAFDYSKIRASRMINLDSEDEHEVVVGCAGGLRLHATAELPVLSCGGKALRVRLDGLFGGHSGTDIALGRVNAARFLCRMVFRILGKYDGRLISLCGGEKDNAIPSSATAEIMVSPAAAREIELWFKQEKRRFTEADKGAVISTEPFDYSGEALDGFTSQKLLRRILEIQNGVVETDARLDSVKTSLNLGVLRIGGGKVRADLSLRSCEDGSLRALADRVEKELAACGFDVDRSGAYPAWAYRESSELLSTYADAYRRLYGEPPRIYSIHAGLECGVICASLRDMDAISIGPTIRNVHTTHERLDTASVARVYQLLKEIVYG